MARRLFSTMTTQSRRPRHDDPLTSHDGRGEDEDGGELESNLEGGREEKSAKNAKRKEEEEDLEEESFDEAKPIGKPIRISFKRSERRKHYKAFEYDGKQYDLEDNVLVVPDDITQKPYVAIIKDIAQTNSGSMMVIGQWFYRPEEIEEKGGGSWQSHDNRELFYSFHRDEISADSVMHKCMVHYVPIHKQFPNRKQNPGLIVQKVYDTYEKKLFELTNDNFEDNKQREIDLFLQKTSKCLGDLPDIGTKNAHANQEDQLERKRSFQRRNVPPLDVSRKEDLTAKSDQHFKAETPGSSTGNASKYYVILVRFNELGESACDKWLERLLQVVQYVCTSEGTNDENGTKC